MFKLNDQVIFTPDLSVQPATVIGTYPDLAVRLLLGWTTNQHQEWIYPISYLKDTDLTLATNYKDFPYISCILSWRLSLFQPATLQQDLQCKTCKTLYPQSQPNQADGSLICWSCRNP